MSEEQLTSGVIIDRFIKETMNQRKKALKDNNIYTEEDRNRIAAAYDSLNGYLQQQHRQDFFGGDNELDNDEQLAITKAKFTELRVAILGEDVVGKGAIEALDTKAANGESAIFNMVYDHENGVVNGQEYHKKRETEQNGVLIEYQLANPLTDQAVDALEDMDITRIQGQMPTTNQVVEKFEESNVLMVTNQNSKVQEIEKEREARAERLDETTLARNGAKRSDVNAENGVLASQGASGNSTVAKTDSEKEKTGDKEKKEEVAKKEEKEKDGKVTLSAAEVKSLNLGSLVINDGDKEIKNGKKVRNDDFGANNIDMVLGTKLSSEFKEGAEGKVFETEGSREFAKVVAKHIGTAEKGKDGEVTLTAAQMEDLKSAAKNLQVANVAKGEKDVVGNGQSIEKAQIEGKSVKEILAENVKAVEALTQASNSLDQKAPAASATDLAVNTAGKDVSKGHAI